MNNDGSVAVAAKFKVEKGSMASAAAAITIDLAGWSTSNYVMDYGSVLSGKRSEQSVKGGGYDHVPFRCKK
jgi:hypothetical protein